MRTSKRPDCVASMHGLGRMAVGTPLGPSRDVDTSISDGTARRKPYPPMPPRRNILARYAAANSNAPTSFMHSHFLLRECDGTQTCTTTMREWTERLQLHTTTTESDFGDSGVTSTAVYSHTSQP